MKGKLTQKEVELLSHRNLRLLSPDWQEIRTGYYPNTALLDATNVPAEYLGYHVGSSNQTVLTATKPLEEHPEISLKNVFFSLRKDALEHYLNMSLEEFLVSDNDEMVYFVDYKTVKEGRVQTSYSPAVLFQDKIMAKEEAYENNLVGLVELMQEYDDWIENYTIRYNPNRYERYNNRKNINYILVKSPIKVILGLNPLIPIRFTS
ncbi:MAG: hypothetical protein ACMXYL_01120 [Candidatus Woesearchaeota archaeon]